MAGENIAPEVECIDAPQHAAGNHHPQYRTPIRVVVVWSHRSAGSWAQLTAKEGKYVIVRAFGRETRMVLDTCYATVGTVSNPDHNLRQLGKAGRKRWLGRRPRNRGVAMNSVDHPMGGGEGRSSGHPRSRSGKYAKAWKPVILRKQPVKFIISKTQKM